MILRSLAVVSMSGLFAASLAAQSSFCAHVPSDTPNSGPCSEIPMGGKWSQTQFRSQRMQVVVTKAELGNKKRTITNLAFAACGTGLRKYGRLIIYMSHHTGQLSTTFASNWIGGRSLVLDYQRYDWPNTAGQWNNIGLRVPYAYDPAKGNLLIDIVARNSDFTGSDARMRSDTRQTVYASGFSALPKTGKLTNNSVKLRVCDGRGFIDDYYTGCGVGPLHLGVTGTPRIGGKLDMRITGAKSSTTPSLGVFLFGAFPAHIGLDPNCFLYVNPFLIIGTIVSSGKSLPLSMPVPSEKGLVGIKLYVQGAHQDAMNTKFGWATTQRVIATVGT